MNTTQRKHSYWRQNGAQVLTPKQRRRLIHKAKTNESRHMIRNRIGSYS